MTRYKVVAYWYDGKNSVSTHNTLKEAKNTVFWWKKFLTVSSTKILKVESNENA